MNTGINVKLTIDQYNILQKRVTYWGKRCEAAENLIAVMNVPKNEADGHNDSFLLFGERNQIWQELKNKTP